VTTLGGATLGGEVVMNSGADHDNDSGCGDDSASSNGSSSSSSSGPASQLNDSSITSAPASGPAFTPSTHTGQYPTILATETSL